MQTGQCHATVGYAPGLKWAPSHSAAPCLKSHMVWKLNLLHQGAPMQKHSFLSSHSQTMELATAHMISLSAMIAHHCKLMLLSRVFKLYCKGSQDGRQLLTIWLHYRSCAPSRLTLAVFLPWQIFHVRSSALSSVLKLHKASEASAHGCLRMSQSGLSCRMLGTPFAADLESRHCFAVLPGASTIVSCGYWDNTVRCYTTHDGKVLQVGPLPLAARSVLAHHPHYRLLQLTVLSLTLAMLDSRELCCLMLLSCSFCPSVKEMHLQGV